MDRRWRELLLPVRRSTYACAYTQAFVAHLTPVRQGAVLLESRPSLRSIY